MIGLTKLIKELKSQGVLRDRRILAAFLRVDRANFVSPKYRRSLAYINYPLPIGHRQTISQPYTVAFMLELLDLKKGEKVLEIGAGSGWQTALLCQLVGKAGLVVAIERILGLRRLADANLAKYPIYKPVSIIMNGDGKRGYLAEAPYDKIIAAASGTRIPEAWKRQLKIGGKIVAPVKNSIWEIIKFSKKSFKIIRHNGFRFVPLV